MQSQISVPTLLLDEEQCRKNIATMVKRADLFSLKFRPHFKTHQSVEIGSWFWEEGVSSITVSSLRMASYFVEAGWQNITVAFPFNVNEIELANRLSEVIDLRIIVEDMEVIGVIQKSLTHRVGVYITVDVGGGRTGIPVSEQGAIKNCIEAVMATQRHQCCGVLSHAGHTYASRGPIQINKIHESVLESLQDLRQNVLDDVGLEVSYGDTPSCSVAENWSGIDEMRPGNFVFYDLMQLQIGSCIPSQIAVAVACPVVAIHPDRSECVIYGGAIHFGRDSIELDGDTCYGQVVLTDSNGQWSAYEVVGSLVRLSQEHGVARLNSGTISDLRVGDVLTILPVHSCMTAQYMGGYKTTKGHTIDHMAQSYLTPK